MNKLLIVLVMSILLSNMNFILSKAETINFVSEYDNVIITFGEDIKEEKRLDLLNDFNIEINESNIVEISNKDEQKYLSSNLIQKGEKSYSSSKITFKNEDSGIDVTTNRLYLINEDVQFATALLTAGVKDVSVDSVSVHPVSGHGTLNGIVKAYEGYKGIKLNGEHIEFAHKEMKLSSRLDDVLGGKNASLLLINLKKLLIENHYNSKEELEKAVLSEAERIYIHLMEDDLEDIVNLYYNMKELNISIDIESLEYLEKHYGLEITVKNLEPDADKGIFEMLSELFLIFFNFIKLIFGF